MASRHRHARLRHMYCRRIACRPRHSLPFSTRSGHFTSSLLIQGGGGGGRWNNLCSIHVVGRRLLRSMQDGDIHAELEEKGGHGCHSRGEEMVPWCAANRHPAILVVIRLGTARAPPALEPWWAAPLWNHTDHVPT